MSDSLRLPIEPCVAVLVRAAAGAAPLTDEGAIHLRVARLLDLLAGQGIEVSVARVAPRLAASELDPSRSVFDLLVLLLQVPECLAAVVAKLQPLRSDENALADAVNRVFVDTSVRVSSYLERSTVLSNEFRCEELVRLFAAALGVALEHEGKPESPQKSLRTLERLDYRKLREDEERLAVERRVLQEHAEKIREEQRRKEQEALAAAQRE